MLTALIIIVVFVKNTTQPSIITVTIFEVFIKWYYLNCQLSNLIPTYSQTRMIQTALVVKKTLSCRYSYGSHLRTVHKMYIRGPKKKWLVYINRHWWVEFARDHTTIYTNIENTSTQDWFKTIDRPIKVWTQYEIRYQQQSWQHKLWVLQIDLSKKKKRDFNVHMNRHTQHGSLEPINGRPRVNLNVILNLDDPNNYCKSCEKSFSKKSNYRAHTWGTCIIWQKRSDQHLIQI